MPTWSPAQLKSFAEVLEILIGSGPPDRPRDHSVAIWVVPVGDEVYVRSWHGTESVWYQNAIKAGKVSILLNGRSMQVHVEPVRRDADQQVAIDAAYRSFYGQDTIEHLVPMTSVTARDATLRLTPA